MVSAVEVLAHIEDLLLGRHRRSRLGITLLAVDIAVGNTAALASKLSPRFKFMANV